MSGTGRATVTFDSQRLLTTPWHFGVIQVADPGSDFEGFAILPLTTPVTGDAGTVFGDCAGFTGLEGLLTGDFDVRANGFKCTWSVTDRR